MKASSNHKSYSASDLERYHKGTMPDAERHALEKAALDDPFLADALEGYAYTQTAEADLSAIREQLEKRSNPRRGLLLGMDQSWLRVAALFVVVAGGAWLLYRTTFSPRQEIAVQSRKENSTPVTTAPPTAAPAESTQDSDAGSTATSSPVTMAQKRAPKQRVGSPVSAQESTAPQAKDQLNEVAVTRTPETFYNKTQESTTLQAPTSRSAQLMDRFPDTAQGAVASKEMSRARVTPDSITNLDVVLQPVEDSLNRITVTTMGVKKRAMPAPQARFEELEPLNGWSQFNDYLADNLQQPRDQRNKPVSGEVELSFDVDREGHAVNIRVVRSLCPGCNEEAIRLLKTGPRWKTSLQKGKIVIRF